MQPGRVHPGKGQSPSKCQVTGNGAERRISVSSWNYAAFPLHSIPLQSPLSCRRPRAGPFPAVAGTRSPIYGYGSIAQTTLPRGTSLRLRSGEGIEMSPRGAWRGAADGARNPWERRRAGRLGSAAPITTLPADPFPVPLNFAISRSRPGPSGSRSGRIPRRSAGPAGCPSHQNPVSIFICPIFHEPFLLMEAHQRRSSKLADFKGTRTRRPEPPGLSLPCHLPDPLRSPAQPPNPGLRPRSRPAPTFLPSRHSSEAAVFSRL